MANWLQKIIPSTALSSISRNLPTIRKGQVPSVSRSATTPPAEVPNASLIYGIAASALFAIAVCYVISGRWVTGGLVLLPAAGLLGFALHFLRH